MSGLHYTPISQTGEIFGLTASAVSRRVGVLKSKAVNDKSIRKIVRELLRIFFISADLKTAGESITVYGCMITILFLMTN